MPRARQRKLPLTSFESQNPSSSTRQSSRTIIRRFHVLLKRRAQLQNAHTQDDLKTLKALADIEAEIAELGGLKRYQHMSAIGQGSDRGGGSERLLVKWLKGLGLNDLKKRQAKLRCAPW